MHNPKKLTHPETIADAIAVFDYSAQRTKENGQTRAWAIIRDTLTKRADDTTIAFVAIGANTALRHATDKQIEDLNERQQGGQDTTIANAIEYAALLDSLFDEFGYDGVFYYDVAEPFGSWITTRMLEGKDTDTAQAHAHVLRLMEHKENEQ